MPDEPVVQIPASQLEQLLRMAGARYDDEGDLALALEDFRKEYERESDVELERKRGIMRNRLLMKHPDKEKNEEKYRILTDIIRENIKRRVDFERQTQTRTALITLAGVITGGGLLPFLLEFGDRLLGK